MLKIFSKTFFITLFLLAALPSSALEEIGSDSRIRTFVYGKNDVYRVITSYGYQTTIEFEEDAKIKTISMGNSGSFKITPQKNRIFVRALQGGQLTNLVVITDKRTYQLELSSILDSLDEMMYVVKFYYPDSFSNMGATPQMQQAPGQSFSIPDVTMGMNQQQQQFQMPQGSQRQPQIPQAPQFGLGQSLQAGPSSMVFNAPASGQLNYNYSLTGPDYLSPLEIYDDGIRTFLKFSSPQQPIFRFVSPNGSAVPVNFTQQGEYYVIDGVTNKLVAYFGSESICIYNEALNTNIR